jgi:hypothetical protein
LIWWLPFGLYLKDSWPFFQRSFVPKRQVGERAP